MLSEHKAPLVDSSGFRFFAAGDAGLAHTVAHRTLDSGKLEQGYQWLRAWFEGRTSEGISRSKWAHLQWHMMVFELAVGDRASAIARFRQHVLPVALDSDDAATDGPAGMWRIALTGPVVLPWEALSRASAARARIDDHPYVALHRVLAMAGAGDVGAIDRWIGTCAPGGVLETMAFGLRAVAAGEHAVAADLLGAAAPHVHTLGGSRAQNELFSDIAARASARAAA